jgi:putative hemolysin
MKTTGIYKTSKFKFIIVLIHILLLSYPSLSHAILSPAVVYCNALGYNYLIQKTPLGDKGICQLPDGQTVDAQDFVEGKVALEWGYCAINGYGARHVESSDLCKNCTICTLKDGSEVEVTILMQLSLEETTCSDGSCGIPENYSNCPEDCPSGGWDGYCDKVKDGIVDPDCDQFADPDNPRYEIGTDYVLDKKSGLIWELAPSSDLMSSWAAAVDYCQAKKIVSNEGWQLPTLEEFNSLVDQSRSNPALPENHPFVNVKIDQGWYWTSTTDPSNSANAFYVDMSDGSAISFNKGGWLGLAWCMRCQTLYEDIDKDGYSSGKAVVQCERPINYYFSSELKDTSGDCNDNDAQINPGVAEVCTDGVDNNCDLKIDGADVLCGGNADTDNDGLSDDAEINIYKSDPHIADTDADGLYDGVEVQYWGVDWNKDPDADLLSNLLDPDSDNDGLIDGLEVNVLSTNPVQVDSDGNGIPDGSEDSDGDGFTNVEELQCGSDPSDPSSRCKSKKGLPWLMLLLD